MRERVCARAATSHTHLLTHTVKRQIKWSSLPCVDRDIVRRIHGYKSKEFVKYAAKNQKQPLQQQQQHQQQMIKWEMTAEKT